MIINSKSQCKNDSLEQGLGKLCSKEAEGAGCECQGTLGFHRYSCVPKDSHFEGDTEAMDEDVPTSDQNTLNNFLQRP